ncbi:hypothetical protein [Curtobacterium oceanosedimentum]|uniref:hypothetical protein n=1 Tax=Curtobacterium oceanosedimentum TaxID=465820 RepID=UPI001CE14AA1|nr:hypothetical protein [Curtobacterium oceanosedimentum]MCA5922552.1 hypothetical protein [Curtobacterium oceanosedimentum]
MTEPSEPAVTRTASRVAAEQRTTEIQDRVVAALPDGAVADERTIDWTLLACSETEVSAAGGVAITLAREIDVDATYEAITAAVQDDGYTAATDTTRKGAKRLTVTGVDDDQYLVTIYNDTKKIRLSSFSQCFPGSLNDD